MRNGASAILRLGWALSVLATCGTRAGAALGAEPSAAADAAAPTVHVTLIGSRAMLGDLPELVRDWFRQSRARARVSQTPHLKVDDVLRADPEAYAARIWVTLPAPGKAVVYIAGPRAKRFLVRELPLRDELDELGRERLAQVVLSAAVGFLDQRESSTRQELTRALARDGHTSSEALPDEGRPAASSPAVAKPGATSKVPPVPRPPVAGPEPVATLFAAYGAAWTGNGMAHGPGVGLLGSLVWSTVSLGAIARAEYELPREIDTARIGLSLQVLALRAGLALESRGPIGAGAELGAGLDAVHAEPKAVAGSSVIPRPAATDTLPVIFAALRGNLEAAPLRLSLVLRFDVFAVRPRYDLLLGGSRREELEGPRVKPRLAVELGWPF